MFSKIKSLFKRPQNNNEIVFNKYKNKGNTYHWEQYYGDCTQYQNIVNKVSELISEEKMVIDIGCGDGLISYIVSKKSKFVYGFDKNKLAIKGAKSKTKEVKNIAFFVKDAYDVKSLEPVDYVISIDVIEHLFKPDVLLKNMASLLKDEGRVIIGTPLFNKDRPLSMWHVKEYTLEEAEELIERYFIKIEGHILQNDDGEYYLFKGKKAVKDEET